jgi:hypothetical protein
VTFVFFILLAKMTPDLCPHYCVPIIPPPRPPIGVRLKLHEVDRIMCGRGRRKPDFACPRVAIIQTAATIAIDDPSLQLETIGIELHAIIIRVWNLVVVRIGRRL